MSDFAEQEPYFRLLVCRTCGVIEELPSGDEDPGDVLLEITVERHTHSEFTHGNLVNVPKGVWMAPKSRQGVIDYLNGELSSGMDSFGTKFYETKSQFSEDAMSCFSLHNRPRGQCSDYRSEKKWLSPKTEQERRLAGLPTKNHAKKVYLCDFCPVKSFNMMKHNESTGLYN